MDQETRKLLVARIRLIYQSNFDMAAHRRELTALATAIDALQARLDASPALWALEDAHEQAHGPQAFEVATSHLRALADTSRQTAAQLPPAQARPALAFAAAAWLHFEALNGREPPAKTNTDPAVRELESILDEAKSNRSTVAVRKALGRALDEFDPTCPPPAVRAFIDEIDRQR